MKNYREQLEQEVKEKQERYYETSWEAEKAESARDGAKKNYDFHTDEAYGKWGNSAPSNTEEYRTQLRDEYRDRQSELDAANYNKAMAKEDYEKAQQNLEEYDKENGY